MIKLKKGYTLAEVLVVLALLGILATILLPAVSQIRPNKNKSMFKKAYYVAERIVYELVNDDDLYPLVEGKTVGFDNTVKVPYNGSTFEGTTKFCQLFAKKINTVSNASSCIATNAAPTGSGTYKTPTFVSTDGVAWYVPISNFSATQTIYVDTNNEQKPNCEYNSSSCKDPDIFRIKVQADGKMYVDGTKEVEYLQSGRLQ